MNPRYIRAAAFFVFAAGGLTATATAQDPSNPGVRLGITYSGGGPPKIIVMPFDSTPGDSVKTIIQRDRDYSDRVTPLVLDQMTLMGLTPASGQSYNYSLFANLGVAAIIQGQPIAGGYKVSLHDVSVGRVIQTRDFLLSGVPANRDDRITDSITTTTRNREQRLKDSVFRAFKARADIMRRPPLNQPNRDRRFIVRDSIRRDSTATAFLERNVARWENERRDSVQLAISRNIQRLARQDSVAREQAIDNQRLNIHRISDEVERWITGRTGIAATRIAYVHNGLIRLVDSDGANDRPVTRRGLSLSPAWHPRGDRIVYSKFLEGGAGTQLEEFELASGRTRTLSPSGLNITPVYSQDGRSIVYASGSESGTELMMANLDNPSLVQRLTFGRGSDNGSPSFSPDGRQIAFFSSRSRFPQIYTMDADGTNLQLLTPFTPGVRSYRAAPDWSPNGLTVAYEQQMGDFQVWMINIRDKQPRQLTSVGENEGPSWAPDGRHIALSSTRGGSKQIWILDTESGRFRQLTRNAGARLAAWSPMISSNVTQ